MKEESLLWVVNPRCPRVADVVSSLVTLSVFSAC